MDSSASDKKQQTDCVIETCENFWGGSEML